MTENCSLPVITRNLFIKDKNNEPQKVDLDYHHQIFDTEKVDDKIWLATDGNGIFILNKDYKMVKHI